MKFAIGDWIIRPRRKVPRQILGYRNGGYELSDDFNGFGKVWYNQFRVEVEFRYKLYVKEN